VPALALSPPQPQPVQDVLVLRAEIPQGPPARLELYDLGGRRVRERAIEGYGVAQLVVGVSDLPAGLYVARLVQGDVARSTRVSLVP
jgi:hypothetical protein